MKQKKKQPEHPHTRALYPAEEKAPIIEQSEEALPPEFPRSSSENGCALLVLRICGIFLVIAGLSTLATNPWGIKGFALIGSGVICLAPLLKPPKKEDKQ